MELIELKKYIHLAYKKLLKCICFVAAPPEMVDYIPQPVKENRLAFQISCLEGINKTNNANYSVHVFLHGDQAKYNDSTDMQAGTG